MKKLFAILLALTMVLGLCSFAGAEGIDEALIAAAKEEGELTVYGSCEEAYLNAACDKFEELYGIKVNRQRLSTGEVAAKIEEENGNPFRLCIRLLKDWIKTGSAPPTPTTRPLPRVC